MRNCNTNNQKNTTMNNYFVDPEEELEIDSDTEEDVSELDFPLDDDLDDDDE